MSLIFMYMFITLREEKNSCTVADVLVFLFLEDSLNGGVKLQISAQFHKASLSFELRKLYLQPCKCATFRTQMRRKLGPEH